MKNDKWVLTNNYPIDFWEVSPLHMFTISICIPTYNRCKQLVEAVQSCLLQTRLPDEIVIGDDSANDLTQRKILEISRSAQVPVRYTRNIPAKGQAQNVNALFFRAQSDLLLLLHDDDLLLPNALADLEACFAADPGLDAAYGKQYIISDEGKTNEPQSENLNQMYYRTSLYEGTKLSSLEAGFLQQFPNDCYLITAHLARQVQYSTKWGNACDFDFGVRVGMAAQKLCFVNTYTAKYRNSTFAISTSSDNDAAIQAFECVIGLDVPAQSQHLKEKWLIAHSPMAIAEALNKKQIRKAAKIYFGKYHRQHLFSMGSFRRLLSFFSSAIKK